MQREKYIFYIFIGICLFCLAAFRPENMDNDFGTYVHYIVDNDNKTYQILVEPSFLMLSKWVMNTFNDYRPVFIIYAFVGVFLKLIAIKRLSPFIFAPLCIYISNFFIMHEFTQIRVGVAVGFVMLALGYQIEHKKLKAALFIALASVFHYSALMIFPMLFLSNGEISKRHRILWAMIIPLGYAIYFLNIGISTLPIPFIEDKMNMYSKLRDMGYIDEVNVFNMLYLLKICIFYYSLYYYDKIKMHVKCFPICFRLMGISLFCFVALTDIPVMAIRISELYGFPELILFSCIIYTVKPRWIGKLATVLLAIALLCLHAFIDDILVIM